ncbi:NAD-dependent epimerase/dehydratase family protein [Rugamonas rubra]|jgi:nucleoside-diphosphate-sugar epimerase|uniref:Nucleoside-diphosphate-sugar epimerase n=1 Tax=Rugamonas rubra TaxID=758825 RepID=A0A1I4N021_9BURK|nr:NAD(P)-dependent oxidoreductase [Rugamonas rubra]SFM08924.1 Nucleoside-diphosphate-sugar epimerase [Rugamonas rubra]
MGQHILVTGGAGYLGSIMVPALLEAGHQVTVLDNFMYRQNTLAQCCIEPRFNVVRGDIRNSAVLKPLLARADIVIPLAALVGAPLCAQDPVGASSVNHDAIKMMLGLLGRQQHILMPTTNSAYGSGDQDHYCDEESPLRPISQYAIDKVAVERHLMEHPNAISFRLATVFGMAPRMRCDLLVNDFAYRAVNDRFVVLFESHFKRNYLHVRDVARVFLHGIAEHARMRGQIYNVGLADANVSKRELCEIIQRHVPDFVFLEAGVGRDPDQRNYIVSNAKLEGTGFCTAYPLDAGIEELVKGYQMVRNNAYSNV